MHRYLTLPFVLLLAVAFMFMGMPENTVVGENIVSGSVLAECPSSQWQGIVDQFVRREVQKGSILAWAHAHVIPSYRYFNLEGRQVAQEFDVKRKNEDLGYLILYLPECKIVEFSTVPSPVKRNLAVTQRLARYWESELKGLVYLSPLDKFYRLQGVKSDPSKFALVGVEDRQIYWFDSNNQLIYFNVEIPKFFSSSCSSHSDEQSGVDRQSSSSQLFSPVESATKKVLSVPIYYQFCYKGCLVGCTPTAGGTLLGYWVDKGYPNLLSNGSQAAIKSLRDRAGTSCCGQATSCGNPGLGCTIYSKLSQALESYCNDKGYPNFHSIYYSSSDASFAKLKNEINKGYPLVVSFSGGPPYDWLHGHSNTGVGYDTANGHYMILQTNWRKYGGQKYVLFESNSHGPVFFNTLHPPDDISPSTSVMLSGTEGENGWYRSNVQVTLSAEDNSGGTGVAQIQYRVDGGEWHTVNDSVTSFMLVGDGGHQVEYRARDKALNWEKLKQEYVGIDTLPPEGDFQINYGAGSTLSALTTLNFSVVDNLSGVWQVRVRNGSGEWTPWQFMNPSLNWLLAPNPVNGTTYEVDVQYRDKAGNLTDVIAKQITLHLYPDQPYSDNYALQRSTFGAAATDASSSHYHLQGTLGQLSLAGMTNSSHYQIQWGYWGGRTFEPLYPFVDVTPTYWAADYITRLYRAGVTGGCAQNPLRYCPGNPVTRAQMAKFILKGEHGGDYEPPHFTTYTFTDIEGSWAADWIEELYQEGIVNGYSDGTYRPNNKVTRAQMAKFIVNAFKLP